MFGPIGQPTSGVKNKQTADIFLRSMKNESVSRKAQQHRRKQRRLRLARTVRRWFTNR